MRNEDIQDMMEKTLSTGDLTHRKKKNYFAIVGAFVVVVSLIVSWIALNPATEVDKEEEDEIIFETNSHLEGLHNVETELETEVELLDEWDFEYPVRISEWAKRPNQEISETEREALKLTFINEAKEHKELKLSVASIPSGEEKDWDDAPPVYTSNIEEKTDENGNLNPYYSVVLAEDYLESYTVATQSLLNPVFGGWVFAQRYTPLKEMKDNSDLEVLKPLFASDWWNANIVPNQDYSKLPILSDWEGDSFSGLRFAELTPGRYGTWYGQIATSDDNPVIAENIGRDKNGGFIIKTTTPVEFFAFGENSKLLKKKGILELTLSSNDNIESKQKVVISSSNLSIN